MELADYREYIYWPLVFLCVAMLHKLDSGLVWLAKRHLPRGTLIRRIVLLSRANEPD